MSGRKVNLIDTGIDSRVHVDLAALGRINRLYSEGLDCVAFPNSKLFRASTEFCDRKDISYSADSSFAHLLRELNGEMSDYKNVAYFMNPEERKELPRVRKLLEENGFEVSVQRDY